jgi:lipid-A-disaccharide synthase
MSAPSRLRPLRIGVVAGEASGDQLGAALIKSLRELSPNVEITGVAGEAMREAGCTALASSDELAVMGFVEPIRHLPRLWRLRSRLFEHFSSGSFDAFIGIDAPAFNLGLAHKLKQKGLTTIQYVSPQVWAWRQGRVRKIAAAVDAVLCLLPFEPEFYAKHHVRAEFVGHPLADQIALAPDRIAARHSLGIAADAQVVAILPGSRLGEVARLGSDFALAARQLANQLNPAPVFVAPMATPAVRKIFARQVAQTAAPIRMVDGQSRTVLAAADAALVASGTATLETLLHGCPMVVAYRVAPLTAFIARDLGLVKSTFMSYPNLLAGEALVPEFLQEGVTPEALSSALQDALGDDRREHLKARFLGIHEQLRQGGAARAARVVLELMAARSTDLRGNLRAS